MPQHAFIQGIDITVNFVVNSITETDTHGILMTAYWGKKKTPVQCTISVQAEVVLCMGCVVICLFTAKDFTLQVIGSH